jgi:hypothetical protein
MKKAPGISVIFRAPIGHYSANCRRSHDRAPRGEVRIYPQNTLPRATIVAHRKRVV